MDRYTALAQFLRESQNRPFAWGEWDCCLFAADAVQAQTGIDYAADYRDSYTTASGALRALKRHGHNTIRDAISAQLGEPLPAALCQRGDVVLVEVNDGELAAGILYAGCVCVLRDTGIDTVNLNAARIGWRVV